MKTARLLTFCFSFCFISSVFSQTTPVSPTEGIRSKKTNQKALINATVILSPGNQLESATLIIKDGFIHEIGTGISIPDGIEIIDLNGFTIYPGFVDPYTDYGMEKPEREQQPGGGRRQLIFDGTRSGGNAWNDAIHAEKNSVESFKPDKKLSENFMEQGITVVQACQLDGIFRGRGFVASLGEDLPNNLILKPSTYHFASFDKGTSKQEYPGSLMGSIALIRQTLYDVQWHQKALEAYNLNKNQNKPEFNNALSALKNIADETIIFEVKEVLSLFQAKQISSEFNIPMIFVGTGEEYAWINQVKNLNSKIIIPIDYPDAPEIKNQYDELDISLATLRHWETAPSNPSILEKNNIDFAFTTLHLKDKSNFLKNIRKAVKRGLSPVYALKALTTVPADICGISNLTGTIEKGKLANFFITNGDIFNDESEIFSTWINGKKHEIKPITEIDFSGNYDFAFQNLNYKLTLKGKDKELSGEIKLNDDHSIKLGKIDVRLDEIYFSIELDTIGIKGVTRFSGKKYENHITGYLTLPDGSSSNWEAIRTSDYVEEEKAAEKEDADGENEEKPDRKRPEKKKGEPEVLVARTSFPNRSFGYEAVPQPENVLIKNATVWTSEADGILENTDILVKDGKFAQIGKNIQASQGYKIIDASGKHVTAGVIDEHSHIAIAGDVNECTEAVTAETRIGDVIDPSEIWIYRQLAGGVTMVQSLHGSCNPIGGQAQVLKLKWGANADDLKYKPAPPTIKFALGENVKRSSWGNEHKVRYPQTRMGVETIIKDAFQAAKEYEIKWNKYSKLNNKEKTKTIPPRKDIELDALVEILNSKMFIHCHSYVQSEILMLMRLAEDFGFRVQNFTHILEGFKVAPEMAKHGATGSSFSDWWAYKFEVYDAIPYNVALMTEKGVISSVNSDNGDLARRLNQEAGKCVKYGDVAREEAIKFCTINSAIQLKVDKWVGSIKVGKDADFVIWSDNPLSIYAKAEQTWIEGAKFFDLETNDALRQQIKEEKNALIQKILKSDSSDSKGNKSKSRWRMYENSFTEDKGCLCIEGVNEHE